MILDLIHPTEYQLHLFHEGNFFECYRLFGAHVLTIDEKKCTRFCVWAPNAKEVSLVSNLNNWNGSGYEFKKVNDEGVWMLIVEQDLTGYLYKYEILTSIGEVLLKSDPYAFFSEERPQTASICYPLDGYQWNDHKWLQKKERNKVYSSPTVIYEMHVGSWKKKEDGSFFSYRELAEEIIPYVLDHGFTHIELLPLVEHPLDISWGYQGTGYFSVTSRYGTPHDLMYFIDQCHQNNIGVIMDWVPGHFCKDAHGLHRFDGSWVYEYETEGDRENYTWGTANFDLSKTEVQSFLISNALFWMEYFHVDGFRVDAVSNIIYWPNSNGQRINDFGIAFLKKLNQIVYQYDSQLLMIAEDSTDWPQVTSPTHYGGLGFNYKWNMGWMNDMLSYMEKGSHERSQFHDKVTFSLLYTFSENYILPFSHDEVVHGKKSLLDKMPGDYWQKFAQLRLLLAYMFGHPGKKLLFMGFELGQFSEWKDEEELDWHLLDYDMHDKMNQFVKELIKVYKRNKPFYELDHLHEGFEWIDVNNRDQSIFSFVRKGEDGEPLVLVCNFTEKTYEEYKVGVPKEGTYREILNTDAVEFGGSGVLNKKPLESIDESFHGREHHITMRIPPFGVSIMRPVKHRKERKGNGKEEVRSYAVSRRARK